MVSLLPHFYATSFEQARKSQLMTQDFSAGIYYADFTLMYPQVITHQILVAKKYVGGK